MGQYHERSEGKVESGREGADYEKENRERRRDESTGSGGAVFAAAAQEDK